MVIVVISATATPIEILVVVVEVALVVVTIQIVMALTMWCLVAMLVVVANGSNIGGSVSDGSHRGSISNSGNNVNYVGGNGGVSDGGGGSKWWCGGLLQAVSSFAGDHLSSCSLLAEMPRVLQLHLPTGLRKP